MILDYTAKGLVLLYEVKWWSAQAWSLQLECPGSRPLILKKKKMMYRTQDGKSTTLTIEPNLEYFQFKELE
jgi:hypothetical protein